MKSKIIFSSTIIFLLFGIYIIVSITAQKKVNISKDSFNGLRIESSLSKPSYIQGEVIFLNLEIRNHGSSEIYLHGTDAQSGYVKILISSDGKNFREYSNAARGNDKTKGRIIKIGESINSQATILSNAIPDTNGLSDVSIRRFEEKQLMTIYAFPIVGTYYIKTVLIIPTENSKIESEPVEINIAEPTDEDLEVWNKIKNRSDIAYFIQQGEFYAPNTEARDKFLQSVEQIINQYSNSFYTESLRQSLVKFRANEEKRKVYLEKMKKTQ